MKIGVVHTSSNNAMPLLELARETHPDVKLINFVDEALWEHVLASGGTMTKKCRDILAADFNRLADAGCDAAGLLCSLVKEGIDDVRVQVPIPIIIYDDAAAERAVAVTPDGGRIAVAAMKQTPLPLGAQAVQQASKRAQKTILVDQICVTPQAYSSPAACGGFTEDDVFIAWLKTHQDAYSAFVIPQVPLSRIMPRIRDMTTPMFDSMGPFLDRLTKDPWGGFEGTMTSAQRAATV